MGTLAIWKMKIWKGTNSIIGSPELKSRRLLIISLKSIRFLLLSLQFKDFVLPQENGLKKHLSMDPSGYCENQME